MAIKRLSGNGRATHEADQCRAIAAHHFRAEGATDRSGEPFVAPRTIIVPTLRPSIRLIHRSVSIRCVPPAKCIAGGACRGLMSWLWQRTVELMTFGRVPERDRKTAVVLGE